MHAAGWGWFLAWAVPGIGLGLGLGVSFVLGPLAVPLALIVILLLRWRIGFSPATFGLLAGIGAVLLSIATHPHGFNPAQWLAAGAAFVAAGVGGYLWEQRA